MQNIIVLHNKIEPRKNSVKSTKESTFKPGNNNENRYQSFLNTQDNI